jgi:hypothetical protein
VTIPSKCAQVRSELNDYLEEDFGSAARVRVEQHLNECETCSKIARGLREVVELTAKVGAFEPPKGFSQRLYAKLNKAIAESHPHHASEGSARRVPIGITSDTVPIGSHLIHFWQTREDFESGVRFLYPGLSKNEHCIIFGHQEALDNVLNTLRDNGYDPDELIRANKLTVLLRRADAKTTLAEIAFSIEAALACGASMVRFLGNLGLGAAPLPAGEDDVLELEAKADALISGLPAIIVCMYDVRTVPGRLLFKGGLERHALSVDSKGVRVNPFCSEDHSHEKKI